MLDEEQRETLYQDYVATGIKILAESYIKAHGGDFTLPSFVEMTHAQEKPEKAEDVINHVLEILS